MINRRKKGTIRRAVKNIENDIRTIECPECSKMGAPHTVFSYSKIQEENLTNRIAEVLQELGYDYNLAVYVLANMAAHTSMHADKIGVNITFQTREEPKEQTGEIN